MAVIWNCNNVTQLPSTLLYVTALSSCHERPILRQGLSQVISQMVSISSLDNLWNKTDEMKLVKKISYCHFNIILPSHTHARFSAPVQTGAGAHPASFTMGTASFPGVKSGQGVTLTPHPFLVPWSWKGRAIPLVPLWAVRTVQSLSACTRVHFTFFYRSVEKAVTHNHSLL